ncbi:MAG: protease modulator HflC [Candidatus Nitrospinota bacterium M3_3B_026]
MIRALSVAVPIVALAALYVLIDSAFIIYQNEQAVVVEFGKFVRTIHEPGLSFKKPFIQNVVKYDNRLLAHDVEPTEIITKDKRTLVIDNFAKWRITDPEQFYKRVKTLAVARARLRDIIYSELRLDFGGHDLEEIVTTHRADLMREVTERSSEKALNLNMGVEIIDVRIKRADLHPDNQPNVFNRMRAERKRIANKFRSEGKEEAQKIRAKTDKEKVIILAEARKKAQEIHGEGDAKAIKITAESFGRDPEFYAFMRSLEAYEQSILEKDRIILSPANPFLEYLAPGR